MGVWEVFRQDRKGQPFEHAGSVVAPDEGLDQSYRRVDGYSLRLRLREARERAGTQQG